MDITIFQQYFSEFWWTVMLAAIGIASIIATFLPAPAPDGSRIYACIYTLFQWCAANVGRARNA